MKILFVCHDTGNTNVLLDTANTLLAKDGSQEVKFLIVGEAAQTIFNSPENINHHKDRLIYLNDWLTESLKKSLEDKTLSESEIARVKEKIAAITLKNLTARPLNVDELNIVKAKIEAFHPDKAITTSSCFRTALAPYQISELLTEYLALDNNFIYNGDFLQDLLNNPFWVSIKGEWATHVSLLVAMAQEQELVKKVNAQLTCFAVGSSAIDKKLDETTTLQQMAELKIKLNAEGQYLLFISGSKTVTDDLELLDMLNSNIDMNFADNTAIRMSLHPGTENKQEYVEKVVGWLKANTNFPAKLVIPPAIKNQLTDLSILNNEHVLEVDLKGDEILRASNAVTSSQPTTQATQAIITGRPAYCLPKYPNSYFLNFFERSPAGLIGKGEDVADKFTRGATFPDKRTVDIISAMLLQQHPNIRRP